MKSHLLTIAFLFTISSAFAADVSPFELHAVADAATNQGIGYLLLQRDGLPETVLLDSTVLLDHTAVKTVALGHEQDGTANILLTFTEAGRKRFAEITTQYVGKRVGVLLDGKLHCAPSIRDPIRGGALTLTDFTEVEATELVKKLNQSIVR